MVKINRNEDKAMLNEKMVALGTQRSVIRELFEYGKQRAAEVGPENVFDFSIGNPSVPAPDCVNETAIKLLNEMDSVVLHGYTSAQGDAGVRKMIADSINSRFQTSFNADNLYMTVGAAAALCCCLNGLTCPGDEFIVFAPYFPEYKVFIEAAGASMKLIPADIEAFQIDFGAFEKAINEHTKGVLVTNNLVTVRKSNDYVAKMIGMAGGEYVFSDLSDNGNSLATINLSLEEFYAGAKDADVLIYNSTIEGKIETTEQLLSKCPMLADFKAVQNGNVWCTTQSLFQESMELPDLILDMNRVFTAESPNAVNEDELKFLTHVS